MVIVKFVVPSKKTSAGVEVLRCTVKDVKKDYEVNKLKEKLREYFHKADGDYLLSWFDGTDECSIVSNADLLDLLEYSQETNKNSNEVRINVKPIESSDPLDKSAEPLVEPIPAKSPEPTDEYEIVQPEEQHETEEIPEQHDKSEDDIDKEIANLVLPEASSEEQSASEAEPSVAPAVQPSDTPSATPVTAAWGQPNQLANPLPPQMMPQFPMFYVPPQPGQWPQFPCQPYFVPPYPQAPIGPETETNLLENIETNANRPSEPIAPVPTVPVPPSASPVAQPSEPRKDLSLREIGRRGSESSGSSKKAHRKEHAKAGASPSKVTDQESMAKLITQFRLMGFNQDEKTIKKLVVKYNGDINKVLDKLNK